MQQVAMQQVSPGACIATLQSQIENIHFYTKSNNIMASQEQHKSKQIHPIKSENTGNVATKSETFISTVNLLLILFRRKLFRFLSSSGASRIEVLSRPKSIPSGFIEDR